MSPCVCTFLKIQIRINISFSTNMNHLCVVFFEIYSGWLLPIVILLSNSTHNLFLLSNCDSTQWPTYPIYPVPSLVSWSLVKLSFCSLFSFYNFLICITEVWISFLHLPSRHSTTWPKSLVLFCTRHFFGQRASCACFLHSWHDTQIPLCPDFIGWDEVSLTFFPNWPQTTILQIFASWI
jgi:hypothetical protein